MIEHRRDATTPRLTAFSRRLPARATFDAESAACAVDRPQIARLIGVSRALTRPRNRPSSVGFSTDARISNPRLRKEDPMPHELIQRPGAPGPQPIRACGAGPQMRWALQHGPKEHKKKHKVLVLIASYADAGIPEPAIRELASRAGLPQLHVATIVNWLERQGFLRVERGEMAAHSRNRYRVITRVKTPAMVTSPLFRSEKGSVGTESHPGPTAKMKHLHPDSARLESVG